MSTIHPSEAKAHSLAGIGLELSPAEIANGWAPKTLAEYRRQVAIGEHYALIERLFPSKRRLSVENCDFLDSHYR